jgi:TPR repeat protein
MFDDISAGANPRAQGGAAAAISYFANFKGGFMRTIIARAIFAVLSIIVVAGPPASAQAPASDTSAEARAVAMKKPQAMLLAECKKDVRLSCHILAKNADKARAGMTITGPSVYSKDEAILVAYGYQKACDLKFLDACWNLQQNYLVPALLGNRDKARAVAVEGCNFGDKASCTNVAEFKAADTYAAAPQQSAPAPVVAAKAVAPAQAHAADLSKQPYEVTSPACHKGDANACFYLARNTEGSNKERDLYPNQKDTIQYGYEHACDAGIKDACWNLGAAHESNGSLEEDFEAAAKWFAKGCVLGDKTACKQRDVVRKYNAEAAKNSTPEEPVQVFTNHFCHGNQHWSAFLEACTY